MSSNAIPSAPPDWTMMQTNANTAFNNAMSNINARQKAIYDQYGFNYTANPDGSYTVGNLDPSNQAGLVQSMLRAHGAQENMLMNRAAERGIGTSGLAAQGWTGQRFANQMGETQLGGQMMNQNLDLQQARNTAQENLNTATDNINSQHASWDAQQAATNPPFDIQALVNAMTNSNAGTPTAPIPPNWSPPTRATRPAPRRFVGGKFVF